MSKVGKWESGKLRRSQSVSQGNFGEDTCTFLKNNCCFSCIYQKKFVPLQQVAKQTSGNGICGIAKE